MRQNWEMIGFSAELGADEMLWERKQQQFEGISLPPFTGQELVL